MTTDELLWNAAFECEDENKDHNSYNYREEKEIEKYYEDKELFERFEAFFKTAS